MKKHIAAAAIAAVLSLSCGGSAVLSGTASFVAGEVLILQGGKTQKLVKDGVVAERDTIVTGADGVAVIDFPNAAVVEVQQNTAFEVRSLQGSKKFFLSKGNVWTMVGKLVVGGDLTVETPNSIASVRGTKFYTFSIGDIHGTCHCEGVIDYKSGNYAGTNDSDFLVFTKNGVSIIVKPSELAFAGMTGHDHSALKDSPLGKCPQNVDMKKVTAYLNTRFAEAQRTGKPR